ncbi:hypothetical protein HX099_10695 [Thiopseudomonas alkaliphila]|uniref:Uncharacterized protein n=1 Tax=Thiopseudomonas alkaliphila TaxID=1697053 RepID=A0AAW7DWN7_9GAMM|nr:hypothetical protein [Thiopseudomonas alkaliphila]MDM1697121.1 hypothetical protein [Thiopseudomonas alkaliphila]
MEELTCNQKVVLQGVLESNDPEVFQEVITEANYELIAPYITRAMQNPSDLTEIITQLSASLDEPEETTHTSNYKSVDLRANTGDSRDMNTITRNEFESKLSEIESKADLRVEKLGNEMLQVISELRIERADRDAKMTQSLADSNEKMTQNFTTIQVQQGQLETQIKSVTNLKGHIWGAFLALAAIIVAVLALNVTSFDSGRNTAADIEKNRYEMLEKSNQRDSEIKSINETLRELTELVKESNKKAE